MARSVGIFLAVMIAAALGVFVLLDDPGGSLASDTAETPTRGQEADLFATSVTFDQLNPDGSLNYRLVAQAIIQYPVEGATQERTELEQPQFHLANAPEPPWDISSAHGELRQQDAGSQTAEEILYLTEDVVMHQQHPQNGVLTIRSDSFTIFPKREYAETDDDVIIDTDVGRTEAAGMSADLASGLLSLSSSAKPQNGTSNKRVHTVVLPEHFK